MEILEPLADQIIQRELEIGDLGCGVLAIAPHYDPNIQRSCAHIFDIGTLFVKEIAHNRRWIAHNQRQQRDAVGDADRLDRRRNFLRPVRASLRFRVRR